MTAPLLTVPEGADEWSFYAAVDAARCASAAEPIEAPVWVRMVVEVLAVCGTGLAVVLLALAQAVLT